MRYFRSDEYGEEIEVICDPTFIDYCHCDSPNSEECNGKSYISDGYVHFCLMTMKEYKEYMKGQND